MNALELIVFFIVSEPTSLKESIVLYIGLSRSNAYLLLPPSSITSFTII